MGKGWTYHHERIRWTDPDTDVTGWQLTSFPTVSIHLPYAYSNLYNGFTADSHTLVFKSRRSASRDAPFDLFRVDIDGTDLTQLTERDYLGGVAVSGADRLVYLFEKGILSTLHLETLEESEIAHTGVGLPDWSDRRIPPGHEWPWGFLSPDDRWFFTRAMDQQGRPCLIRVATDGSDVATLHVGDDWLPQSIDPAGRGIYIAVRRDGSMDLCLFDFEGRLVNPYGCMDRFAHACPLGDSGWYQACALPPERALLTLQENQGTPGVLAEGPYFWHSSASLDGQWIVADTNWPNEGLQLVCVKTRRFCTLLHPRNSGGHPQSTHAHPKFSPDGRYVAFNSDQTGIGQVYMVEVPEQFKRELE